MSATRAIAAGAPITCAPRAQVGREFCDRESNAGRRALDHAAAQGQARRHDTLGAHTRPTTTSSQGWSTRSRTAGTSQGKANLVVSTTRRTAPCRRAARGRKCSSLHHTHDVNSNCYDTSSRLARSRTSSAAVELPTPAPPASGSCSPTSQTAAHTGFSRRLSRPVEKWAAHAG